MINWKRTEDQLPIDYGQVLCYMPETKRMVTLELVEFGDSYCWIEEEYGPSIPLDAVSHWTNEVNKP